MIINNDYKLMNKIIIIIIIFIIIKDIIMINYYVNR